jgi:hypothetical protein
MKAKTNKLILFVIIVAFGLLLTISSALANDHQRRTIHGVYGWTGPVNCISTPSGFNNMGKPNNPASLSVSSNKGQGTCTFNHDGTGEVHFTSVGTTESPSDSAGGVLTETKYKHTYKITEDGAISIDAVPNTYVQTYLSGPYKGYHLNIDILPLTGWVSSDYKTMAIATPEPQVLTMTFVEFPFTLYGICHASFTLVRLSD